MSTGTAAFAAFGREARRGAARPWLLALPNLVRLPPLGVALLVGVLCTPVSLATGNPVATPLILAYGIGIAEYLVRQQEQEFDALRPLLTCGPDEAQRFREGLSRHPRVLMRVGWLIGPLAMGAINFNGPRFTAIRAGQGIGLDAVWGLMLASVFWAALWQMLVIFFRNAAAFRRLGEEQARIDLLDVASLAPFGRVAVRNLLIFLGGYIILPLGIAENRMFVPALATALAITVPCSVALLALPMMGVHRRLRWAKRQELEQIRRALRGEPAVLAGAPLRREGGSTDPIQMVLYRELVRDSKEWPTSTPVVLRFAAYIVLPFLAWVAAAIVQRFVDLLF